MWTVFHSDLVKLALGQEHGFFCKSTVSLFVNAMNIQKQQVKAVQNTFSNKCVKCVYLEWCYLV